MTKITKATKNTSLKNGFSILPSSRKNRILLILILIVGASIAGLVIYRSFAYTPPLKEGTNGCLYDYFENKQNNWRAAHGLYRYTAYGSLESHACTLAKKISRTNPRSSAQLERMHDISWCANACGQNMAHFNQGGDYIFNAWMNSPSHRPNIVSKTWRNHGCAHLRANGMLTVVCNFQRFN